MLLHHGYVNVIYFCITQMSMDMSFLSSIACFLQFPMEISCEFGLPHITKPLDLQHCAFCTIQLICENKQLQSVINSTNDHHLKA